MKNLSEVLWLNVTEDNMALVCVEIPPRVHSAGIWRYGGAVLTSGGDGSSTFAVLERQMGLAFFTTQILHHILRCFGIPVFVSQMLAGLILGPGVLGNIPSYAKFMLSIVSQNVIGTLTLFGYSMFLFLIGVKMDIGIVLRTGKKALYTGVLASLIPLILSLLSLKFLTNPKLFQLTRKDISNLVFSAITNSQSSFPVIACLLGELRLLTSELGRLGLSSAIVCDILSLFLRSFTRLASRSMNKGQTAGLIPTLQTAFFMLVYIFAVVYVARPAMNWIIQQTPKGKPVHKGYLFFIMLVALITGLFSYWLDQFFYFGPFIFGLAVPDGPPLGSSLIERYDFMVSAVLLPLFVTSNVLLVNPKDMSFQSHVVKANATLLLVSTAAKLVGTFVPAVFCKMPLMDALVLALILSCKGVVELGNLATDGETLDNEVYCLMVFAILINACIVPLLVKHLYKPSRKYAGYQQRNVSCLRPNSELRILACIHRQDNISAVINLLDACCPTKDNPIGLYVLHLIQMFGQATPLFISHRMQRKTISNCAYSEDVLLSFFNFERDFCEAVTVHPFTAVCPSDSMHEDICTLALDRLASLLILPFHRHWTLDGSIKSQDPTIRSLNISVLERAPCSVGILVNRGPLRQQGKSSSSSQALQYKVALIFLGGEDDREALALTQRMAADPSISLTVYYLTASTDSDVPDWGRILDMESLRSYKEAYVSYDSYAFYTEEVAENGPQTVAILRNIVNQYELLVVGRRKNMDTSQTSGLDEWSEFPELGIVGDMIASDDFRCRCSILVVQKQQYTTS
ncbi:unnamed protein product [Prunus armeniaca]